MKIEILLLILISLFCTAHAQTNTFPSSGDAGIGVLNPSSYFHGGNNRVMEIYNSNNTLHSQSHIVLSSGALMRESSVGSISWVSRNSSGFKGLAYVSALQATDATTNALGNLVFATSNGAYFNKITMDPNGNLGIGIETPGEKLSVNGNIRAREIKVETNNWPDYVFKSDYKMPLLSETEQFIKTHGHLPDVPKAEEVETNGVPLGEMNKILLKKIEELTLHVIELDKSNRKQQDLIETLQKKIK
ncbi:hypothetical protein D3C87_511350 [compost metagenome]